MSRITVLGFTLEDESEEDEFIRQISDATVESLLILASAPEKMASAPVVDVRRMRGLQQSLEPEGEKYKSIYYLNEAAVEMCRERAVSLPVIGEVEEMPRESSYELQAQYLPVEHRSNPVKQLSKQSL